jgi:uncharacterized membrane protein
MLRAALLGAATGMRSTVGLAAVVLTRDRPLPGPLRRRLTARAVTVSVVGELVADKLPSAHSRLEPPGLVARGVAAGLAAALVSDREGARVAIDAVVAATVALVSAKVAHDVRVRAADRWGATRAAVAEDALALALAFGAATAGRTRPAPGPG